LPAVSLLAQTFAHPAYLGIKGAKEILQVLNEKYSFKLDLNKLTDEIDEMEKELMNRAKSIQEATEKSTEQNYFG
jgi:predicted ATP-grasp superfamily ATP-dependent carboligase